MSEIIIHIGLHKTGTTFLQNRIFPLFNDISIIRAWYSHRKIIEMSLNEKILISDEGISGDPWKTNYFEQFKHNILNVKRIYGNVKIIVGFRKHSEFVLSLYKQYLHQKGTKDFSFFFNKSNNGILKHEELFFKQRLEMLQNYFNNVYVYTQEDLNSDILYFTKGLADFLDVTYEEKKINKLKSIKENKGVYTEFQVRTLRQLNKLNKSSLFPNLYSNELKKYSLTPRQVCQNRLNNIKSNPYKLSEELLVFINEKYRQDWDYILKNKESK